PLPPVLARVGEGVLRDARGGLLRDDLDRLHDAGDHHVLEPAVEVLGVLAHHHEVHVVVAALHSGQGLDRAHVGVEVEGLAQGHVHRTVAGADRRRRRPLQGDPGALDGLEDGGRQGVPLAARGLRAGHHRVPFEVDAGGGQHAHRRRRDLRADAVAGNEGDFVRFHGISLPARARPVRSLGACRAWRFRIFITSAGVRARWRMPTSSSFTLPRRTTVSRIHLMSPSQYWSSPARITGNGLTLRVWIRVTASNSSSSVPKPPGMITKAWLYFTNMTLRTKK